MWRAVPIKIHLTMLRRLSPIGVGPSVKIWVRCTHRIVKLLVLNINLWPLNIQISPKITRPYTVSGINIPFNRPIQIWTITHSF